MLPRAASMRLAGVLARFTPPRRDDLPWVGAVYRLPVPKKWAVSSAVEHCFHTAGATGSIPVPPTINQAAFVFRAAGFRLVSPARPVAWTLCAFRIAAINPRKRPSISLQRLAL